MMSNPPDEPQNAAPAPEEVLDVNGDEFASLLRQYDEEEGKAHAANEQVAPQSEPEAVDPRDLLTGDLDRLEKSRMREYLSQVDAEHRAEKAAQQDREDWGRVTAFAKDLVAEFPSAPEGYAELWLRNELTTDPEFRQVLADRYTSPRALDRAERAMERQFKKLRDHVRSFPDRHATEDREAVAAAVRGGPRTPPPPSAPNYATMTDKEFSKSVESDFGFKPSRLGY